MFGSRKFERKCDKKRIERKSKVKQKINYFYMLS